MIWHKRALALIALALCVAKLHAQTAPAAEPTDLNVELRSTTGSTRFQLGDVIPLELLVSSSTPNRYLEPCTLFSESCFGYPSCRFTTHWTFDVTPAQGWTDIGFHGCSRMSGPTYDVKSSDLTTDPKRYPYTLTTRFRFDTPGRYTVRLTLTFGLDDETNQLPTRAKTEPRHNSVSKTAELVLHIVPAGDAWKQAAIQQGIAAWTTTPPPERSPGYPLYRQQLDTFCNLGTPEAAVAFVQLLSQGHDTRHCIRINSNKQPAIAEMRRLLTAPDTAIDADFFAEYSSLLSNPEGKPSGHTGLTPDVVNTLRNTLFASLQNKTPHARILSLNTVLRFPFWGYWVAEGLPYDLRAPYSADIIAMTATLFDQLPPETQAALLDREWDHVRSPLMLPIVQREALKDNGHALLRWQQLDPAPATAYMRTAVLLPTPRFSATYLRLPETSLPEAQQQQLAANFTTLTSPRDLITQATILHRYATRTVLPTVLPFIDEHLATWSCDLQIPVLAYLLKSAPEQAQPRLGALLKTVRPGYCPEGQFFADLGFLQPSLVVEALALAQVTASTNLEDDALLYLKRYGTAAAKPILWDQYQREHKQFVSSGAEQRYLNNTTAPSDWQRSNLDSRLQETYVAAHGWVLSPADATGLKALIGAKAEGLACTFHCGAEIAIGPAPGTFYIYGRVPGPLFPPNDHTEYLFPTEPFQYQINQYACPTLQSLEEKVLQFPTGSTFNFARTGSADDVGDWPAIRAFLLSHNYKAGN